MSLGLGKGDGQRLDFPIEFADGDIQRTGAAAQLCR
jgi:hypothetical protein